MHAISSMSFLNSPEKVAEIMKLHINPRAEELWILCLNSQGKLLNVEMIFRGTIDLCPSHPREIFRTVISHSSSSFVMAHNHPSGDPTPSPQDLRMTKRICKLASLFDIPLLDHIIFADNGYVSLRREGHLGRKNSLKSKTILQIKKDLFSP